MPSITLLEQVLRRQDGERHARSITRILRRRRDRLQHYCDRPLTQKKWQNCQQLIAVCDASLDIIAVLYRRYHNREFEKEKSYGSSR